MKKFFAIAMIAAALTSCGGGESKPAEDTNADGQPAEVTVNQDSLDNVKRIEDSTVNAQRIADSIANAAKGTEVKKEEEKKKP